jgi:plastocyanin
MTRFRWLATATVLLGITLFTTIAPLRRLVITPAVIAFAAPQVDATVIVVRGDALQSHVFDPTVIQIKAGTTVTWRFEDRSSSGAHNVVSINVAGRDFASPVLLTGQFTHTFTTPGEYIYDCTLHRNMRGKIVVVP